MPAHRRCKKRDSLLARFFLLAAGTLLKKYATFLSRMDVLRGGVRAIFFVLLEFVYCKIGSGACTVPILQYTNVRGLKLIRGG